MALNSSSRRLVKLARQIDDSEFAWSPHFDTRPDETVTESLPFFAIIEDIHDWLRKDEIARYATEPAGSDYFQRAWKDEEQFNKTRSHFNTLSDFGFVSDIKLALGDDPDPNYAKKTVAEMEYYLDCFRHALQHQLECATAARAYGHMMSKEHDKEPVAFVPLDPMKLEEALDLHLIDIGKYDPLLKHHIHAAFHNAVHIMGDTPLDALDARFDAANFDAYFAMIEGHLRNNINTLGKMTKVLSRYRERIDEVFQGAANRER
jgi:hypothetical protein